MNGRKSLLLGHLLCGLTQGSSDTVIRASPLPFGRRGAHRKPRGPFCPLHGAAGACQRDGYCLAPGHNRQQTRSGPRVPRRPQCQVEAMHPGRLRGSSVFAASCAWQEVCIRRTGFTFVFHAAAS
ncbi:hypothetical protein AAFF_G00388180 [Aldrovandia affinis]|uniref:Secreted protein n=1 Tax=Aldrovandia affinis TaxID=143900 RepID=A0AAD7SET4_9TELE|nr:hypothetical protein AAFF_G00388180 [Aldrovandia affinis]